jgi:hypothetical protein
LFEKDALACCILRMESSCNVMWTCYLFVQLCHVHADWGLVQVLLW